MSLGWCKTIAIKRIPKLTPFTFCIGVDRVGPLKKGMADKIFVLLGQKGRGSQGEREKERYLFFFPFFVLGCFFLFVSFLPE